MSQEEREPGRGGPWVAGRAEAVAAVLVVAVLVVAVLSLEGDPAAKAASIATI